MTRRRHFQGIFSSMESGVWPKAPLNCLEGPFFRLRTSPRSMTTTCSQIVPSIRTVPKEKWSKRIWASLRGWSRALLGGNSREGGPALFHLLAAAVRAQDFCFFAVGKRQNLGEQSLTTVAEEFAVGHGRTSRAIQ